jgi:predicted ArsR family transcriptional regulator
VDSIDAVGALQDPVRRRLYDFVAGQGDDVSRNRAAAACGIQRTLAAFHLDKLADVGLLDVTYRRLSGRSGPGAGRPAKLYRRAGNEHVVSVPPRAYSVAAGVLADALDQLGADREVVVAARRAGREIGAKAKGESLGRVLRRQGYEPYESGRAIRLRNCPFHQLAERFPPLVCGMNAALCEGILEALGVRDRQVRLDPRAGECCVVISKIKKR